MMPRMTSCLLLTLAVTLTSAYPSGAPPEACASLNPTSHGASTATGEPPYTLTMTSPTYTPGQLINITLTAVGAGNAFVGVLVEGFAEKKGTENRSEPVGFFKNPPPALKLVCMNMTGNGITHVNATSKTTFTVTWQAPNGSHAGHIHFHYTVVRGHGGPADYFMDIKSDALKPAKLEFVQDHGSMMTQNDLKRMELMQQVEIYDKLMDEAEEGSLNPQAAEKMYHDELRAMMPAQFVEEEEEETPYTEEEPTYSEALTPEEENDDETPYSEGMQEASDVKHQEGIVPMYIEEPQPERETEQVEQVEPETDQIEQVEPETEREEEVPEFTPEREEEMVEEQELVEGREMIEEPEMIEEQEMIEEAEISEQPYVNYK